MEHTTRRFLVGAICLAFALAAPPVRGEPRTDPAYAESQGDSALALGHFGAAARRYEAALEGEDLTPGDRARLTRKAAGAQRALHEAILAARSDALAAGRPAESLQFTGFSEPDLRTREFELVRRSASALIAQGKTEPVYGFLEGFMPPGADGAAVRADLWRALAVAYRPGSTSRLGPPDYARAVGRAESLAAHAPGNRALIRSLDDLRSRAIAFHEDRAAAFSSRPCAAWVHYALSVRYGGPVTRANLRNDQEVRRLTRPAYDLSYSKEVREPCVDLARRLEAILAGGEGVPVSASFALERCGPEQFTSDRPGDSTLVVRVSPDRRSPPTTRRTRTGTVLTTPGSVIPGARRTEWVHLMETWKTYVVQGTVSISCEWGQEQVSLDVHPRPRRGDLEEDWIMAATHETVDAIDGAWGRIVEARVGQFLDHAAECLATGRSDDAEEAYAMTILALEAVTGSAEAYYESRYGLSILDLVRALSTAPLP